MRTNHDDPQGGHFGTARTLDAIRRKYFWHGMAKGIKKYVKTCNVCQRVAVHRHREYGMLEPLPRPKRPFETITLDFITGLPPSRWRNQVFDSILVIVDPYTKWSIYVPCRKDIDAKDLAEIILERLSGNYGMPRNIISDRGSVFTSKFWSTLCFYLGARRRLSTAFHPQTDGQTERQNQTLEHFLRCFVNFEQDDWARWLPLAQFTYNHSIHSSTGVSPAEALMGFRGDLSVDVDIKMEESSAPKQRTPGPAACGTA
jgi:transposase InsO family protein